MHVTRRVSDQDLSMQSWDRDINGRHAKLCERPLQDASTHVPVRRLLSTGGRTARASIINATTEGDYIPTSAQLLAAELAEDLYGAEITFVQADPCRFRELVQKLTGVESLNSSFASDHNHATPVALSTLCRGPETSSVTGNKCADVEGTISGSTSGPGREHPQLQASSGPGPRRSSTLKLLERRQAKKKLELQHVLGTSASLRSTCNSYLSSSPLLSPVSPFSVYDIFDSSTTPTSRNNSSYSNSSVPVSPTAFPQSPTALGSQECNELRQMMDPNPNSKSLSTSWETSLGTTSGPPQLLPLFPEKPSHR